MYKCKNDDDDVGGEAGRVRKSGRSLLAVKDPTCYAPRLPMFSVKKAITEYVRKTKAKTSNKQAYKPMGIQINKQKIRRRWINKKSGRGAHIITS